MYSLGICGLFQWHHTISSCEKQWSCHLLSVGFLAFCFPQLLGCTGRAMEVQAEAPLPVLGGFWGQVQPLHDRHSSVRGALGKLGSRSQGFLSFPQRNESVKSGRSRAVRGQQRCLHPRGRAHFVPFCAELWLLLSPVCAVTPKAEQLEGDTAPLPKTCPGTSPSACRVGGGGAAPAGLAFLSQKVTSSEPSPAPVTVWGGTGWALRSLHPKALVWGGCSEHHSEAGGNPEQCPAAPFSAPVTPPHACGGFTSPLTGNHLI